MQNQHNDTKLIFDIINVYSEQKKYLKIIDIYFKFNNYVKNISKNLFEQTIHNIFNAFIYTGQYEEAFIIYQKYKFINFLDVINMIDSEQICTNSKCIFVNNSKICLELYLLEYDVNARNSNEISPEAKELFLERRETIINMLGDAIVIKDLIYEILDFM